MPKGDALFVARREENASSLMSWASMAGLAEKRMLCAFFLLWSSGTYSPSPSIWHRAHFLVTSLALLFGNIVFNLACVSVCASGVCCLLN